MYTKVHSGHSQKARSPLSTHKEWWLQDRLLQGPLESVTKSRVVYEFSKFDPISTNKNALL